MKKLLLLATLLTASLITVNAQQCPFDHQITTTDSVLCAGDSTLLTFNPSSTLSDTVLPTPIVNNNGQDGNMFDITATNTIRITYFEGLIANTPNPVTQYYIYYKVGSHVGFESNAAAWTMIAGPVAVTCNAPNTMTTIPVNVNIVIPAGQTYSFYLTNTSAITNNNRYHNGTATGNVLQTNADLTIYEGTGGAYPFGTFFNARPWEGIVHYDFPPPTYLWNTGATTSSIMVQPGTTTPYSCVASFPSVCFVEDTINVQVNALPVVALGNDTTLCLGDMLTLDAGNSGSSYLWCNGDTTQTSVAAAAGPYCVMVNDVNGCGSSDWLNLMINNPPVISTTGDTVCAGSMGTLTAAGNASIYTWNPGALNGGTVTDMPSATTTYTVTASDPIGCLTIDSATIWVNNPPVIALTADTICVGDGATLIATGNAASFDWMPGNLSGDTISVPPAVTTTYTVTATDINGCITIDSTWVIVNPLPVIATIGDTICAGETGTMYVTGTSLTYLWNPGSFTGNMVSDSPATTTQYWVIGTDVNGCMNSTVAYITVNPLPAVTVSSFGTHCFDDDNLILTGATPAGGGYSGPGVAFGQLDPSAAGNGTHYIVYSYTDANGCSNSDSNTVVIDACVGIVSHDAQGGVNIYPNPMNGSAVIAVADGVVLENAQFTMYDVTGKAVMQISGITSNNVVINRDELADGVYFYNFVNNGVVIGAGKLVVE